MQMNLFKTWVWVILQHVFIYFFNNKNYNDDTKIRQYFIMHGMVLCIKVDIYVSHIIYAYPFSHNTEVPISIKNNKIILSLDTYTTVFSWGSGNSNQYRT